jgi:hypothetical protein
VALGLSDHETVSAVSVDARETAPAHLVSFEPVWPIVRWIHPTLRDWAEAHSFAPEHRLGTRLVLPLAGACMFGGFVSGYFGWSTGLLHLLCLYLVIERVFPWLRLRRRSAELEGSAAVQRVTITPEGVVIDRGFDGAVPLPTTSSHRWDELAGYTPCPQALVLLLREHAPLILPRTAFSELEFGVLGVLVRGKLGPPRPARLRGALRPLLVSASVLVAWALWQAQF